ncbi:MAG TPA: hypothetical protein VIH30_00120 [Aquirhabdus sp.]
MKIGGVALSLYYPASKGFNQGNAQFHQQAQTMKQARMDRVIDDR